MVTDDGPVRCGAVVICADAWTNGLLEPLGHRVSMAVTREQVSYFPTTDLDDLRPGRFPVWIWMHAIDRPALRRPVVREAWLV